MRETQFAADSQRRWRNVTCTLTASRGSTFSVRVYEERFGKYADADRESCYVFFNRLGQGITFSFCHRRAVFALVSGSQCSSSRSVLTSLRISFLDAGYCHTDNLASSGLCPETRLQLASTILWTQAGLDIVHESC